MKGLATNFETLGLDYGCSVIEAAFVEFDTEDLETPVANLTSYVMRFRPDRMVAEPYALQMHLDNGLLYECLSSGVPEEEAWIRIGAYLDQYLTRTQQTKVVLAGKNLGNFDLHFVPKWLKSRFHYRVIDVGSMYLRSDDAAPPSLSDCLDRSGFEVTDLAHRALSNARDVVRVLQAQLLRLKQVGLG